MSALLDSVILVAIVLVLCAWWDHLVETRHHQDVQRYIDPRE